MAKPKLDAATAEAVDLARAAAVETGGADAVGDHQAALVEEGDRIVTHIFECLLPGYADWHWAVTLVRASRAKTPTVNEVVLLPGAAALLAPAWVPWEERIGAGDIGPGMLMATPDNDPRLEPGFAATDLPVPAKLSMVACLMPMPRDTITTIEATPMTMPRTVRNARSFRRHRFKNAVVSRSFMLILPPVARVSRRTVTLLRARARASSSP